MTNFDFMTPVEFEKKVNEFNWSRNVNEVHMHHTYKPNKKSWAVYGTQQTQQGMYDYHVHVLGWSDIAQHVSIMPDGTIVSGRDWNRPPASAYEASTRTSFNGNYDEGPFMFEMVGWFDEGEEILEGFQLDATLHVIYSIQKKFDLPVGSLKFHRHLHTEGKPEPKSCPGSVIDYLKFKETLVAYRKSQEEG